MTKLPSFSLARVSALASGLVLSAASLQAHPGHDGGHGFEWDFAGGFAHPIGGLDHLLAMVAVGVWAAQLGGRARWAVPATFVGVMVAAAALGMNGIVPGGVEQMIAASLLAFGLMITVAKRMPLYAGIGLTALFAAFHGFAHGSEIPAASGAWSYGFGFVVATALLHGAGYGFGKLVSAQRSWLAETAGMFIAVIGAILLAV